MANSVSLNSKSISTDSKVANQGEVSASARAKLQLNVSIMEASAQISIGAQNDPQALLYKSAITGINEALRAELGENAVQNAARNDNSPEATADRIVSLATGFYGAFKKQNPGTEDSTALQKFMDTVRGGVEQGFKEARDILKGLNVLGGDIAGNIDKTYELVMKGLDAFAQKNTQPKEEIAQAEPQAA
ncbi:hypothetical protein IP91_02771 [Pseudoduganella lurida]|uniref:DUF5610 domain-containing protein n=1 Tax=Pseudoduganella lurida TaxID=1036180 RepID=A0A562R8Z6_9BURK|nr:DUF5610 domain-containing protein [Pseudoduganella lurida]TWI65363.1 hypothetical protein IP91_02771 [Pseudoduganella lurida]